jgi:phosphate transport system substrate-binding protein
LWAAPIGQDGIAIIVHPDVDVTGLSVDELRAVYQGRITRWEELGGSEGSIVVFTREQGSGTRAGFERLVMGRRTTTPNARIAASSQQVITTVARTHGAIGYISMGYLDSTTDVLRIDDVLPTSVTVFDNVYPLRTTLYVVGLQEPEDQYRQFIGWIQSPEGQVVVAQRYAPLIPLPVQAAP